MDGRPAPSSACSTSAIRPTRSASARSRSADTATSSGTTRRSSTGQTTARSSSRCRRGGTTAVPAVDCLAKEITGAGGGAVVAQLDGRELVSRGVITHGKANSSGCWNPLQRSIVIGDELATIGLDQVQFSDRQTLEPRDGVSWGTPEEYGCYWYVE